MFRLIAIKTGKRIKEEDGRNFLKVLEPETIYKFYNQYDFEDNSFDNITHNQSSEVDLYKLSNHENTKVNISAVVGENGAGKSSLTELIYAAIYNIGVVINGFDGSERFKAENVQVQLFYCLSKKKDNKQTTKYFLLTVDKDNIEIQYFKNLAKKIIKEEKANDKKLNIQSQLSDFFYSVVVNYSHYALNEKVEETGPWIRPLFHKNDAYQVPMVLNPRRTNGNIEINKQNDLLSQRLQATLLQKVESLVDKNFKGSLRNIIGNKIAVKFIISLNKENYEKHEQKSNFNFVNRYRYIEAINEAFGSKLTIELSDTFTTKTINYVSYKLQKILDTYSDIYHNFSIGSYDKLVEFLSHIRESQSHIVFKVKGTIVSLIHLKNYYEDRNPSDEIAIETLANAIHDIDEDFYINPSMMIPPPFYNVEIVLEENNKYRKFGELSSGEKQRIHSLSSIVYHLINLNSVEKNNSVVKYENVNIILDEIELYLEIPVMLTT